MPRVTYLTSFNADMYQGTGKNLLLSYAKWGKGSSDQRRMLATTEGEITLPAYAEGIDLDIYYPLHEWLACNADIIPKYLGGNAEECMCPDRHRIYGKHTPGCPGHWFNRNASRWFRKIVSWNLAAQRDDIDYLIWLDSDCEFVALMPMGYLDEHLGETGAFYFRGERTTAETGIVGFNLRAGGRELIKRVYDRYVSKRFRADLNWEDGAQFLKTVEESLDIPTTDLVWAAPRELTGKEAGKPGIKDVVVRTTMYDYIRHKKGHHGKTLGLMK